MQGNALTRYSYNAASHPIPFLKASSVTAPKQQAKEAPDLEEAIEEEDDAQLAEPAEEDDDEIDLKKDKLIKAPKKKPAKKPAKKAAKAADDEDDAEKPKKGKGKAKAATGKGKAK